MNPTRLLDIKEAGFAWKEKTKNGHTGFYLMSNEELYESGKYYPLDDVVRLGFDDRFHLYDKYEGLPLNEQTLESLCIETERLASQEIKEDYLQGCPWVEYPYTVKCKYFKKKGQIGIFGKLEKGEENG